MIFSMLLGSFTVIISMSIQVVFVVMMVRYLIRVMANDNLRARAPGFVFEMIVISMVLLLLFAGHMGQIAIWAMLYMNLGEFEDFLTAFYHSAVNFSSLGYGDIVMSERWRLLGALEAANGVLMFGLSTGTILSVMNRLFALRKTEGLSNDSTH